MSATMRAVRFAGIGKPLEVLDVPTPEPGPGEVLVRVVACGICASDLHMMDGSLPVRTPPPVTPGHEAAGVIAGLGRGVDGWSEGERVTLYAGKPCGVCTACRAGRGATGCIAPLTFGVDYDGAWADYCVVPAEACVRLPDAVSFEVGAILADCVATPFNAVVDVAQVRAGERVAVFGIGGLGTHGVQIARMSGAGFLAAVDPSPGARERALRLGADIAVPPDGAIAAIREATAGEGVDASFDFVGVNAVLKQAMAALAPGGRCVQVGVSGQRIELGPSILFAVRRSRLIGSYGYRREHLELLARLVASGRLDLSGSISAKLPLEQAAEGVEMLESKRGDPVRILLVTG
jgi:D-arabinose 1-dehydrogenase-like Zn-dependent alcohol dehydrogenase